MVTIPSEIIISDVSITQNIPIYKTTSASEIVRIRDRGIHYLTGDMSLTCSSPQIVEGFLLTLRNAVTPFELNLPGDRFTSSISRNPAVSGSASIGAKKVTLTNFTGSIKVGDIFNIPHNSKVYYVTKGGETDEIIEFYPPLNQPLTSVDVIEFIDPVISARLDDSSQTVSYDESGLVAAITVKWREVL